MTRAFSKTWIIGILAVVLAGGFFAWQKFGEQKTQDGTTDWDTYKNEQYGFEIKYPENFIISEENLNPDYTLGMVSFFLPKADASLIRIDINNRENFRVGTRDWKDFKLDEKNLSISCTRGVGCEIGGLFNNNYIYYIITQKDPRSDLLIYQILSTFRFSE